MKNDSPGKARTSEYFEVLGVEKEASVSPIPLVLGWAGVGSWAGAHGDA